MDYVCIDCGEPRRTFREVSAGTYQYDPCESCGAIGIERQRDSTLITRKKKASRDIYERSRYRGGKLAVMKRSSIAFIALLFQTPPSTPPVGYKYLYCDNETHRCTAVLSDGTRRACTAEEEKVVPCSTRAAPSGAGIAAAS